MQRSLANLSVLTRAIAAAVAASACGGMVHHDGAASESGGAPSDSGIDSTIGDAATGDEVVVSCHFSPDGIPAPGGDCGVALAEITDAQPPGVDPSFLPYVARSGIASHPASDCGWADPARLLFATCCTRWARI